MKIVTIQKLRLQNFKGVKDFTLEPFGNNISVSGDNATGKTTLADAFFYLLFGKDSNNKADFQLKPVDELNNEKHNLETEVEATLNVNNKSITLLKRYKEKYTKSRGEATKSFTGHTTDYFIDEVPAKAGEFAKKVAELIDVNAFKLVTNPYEFNLLHWTGRRQILLEMCGDVSDQDVIDSDKKLKSLSSILGDCSVDDHKKKIKAKKADINKELEQIPVRISENQEAVKEVEQPDQKEKDILTRKLKDHQESLRSLVSNEKLSEKQIELNEVNRDILLAQNEAEKKQNEAKKPILDAIDNLESDRRQNVSKINDLKNQIAQDEKRNTISLEAIEKVRARWFEENEKHPSGDNTCPSCGQDLPEDQVESIVQTFNRLKSDRLEKINAEGKELKANIEQRDKDITAAKLSINTLEKALIAIEHDIQVQKEELGKVYTPVNANTDDLDKKKDILVSEIAALKNGSLTQEKTAKRYITETQTELDEWNKDNAAWEAAETARARIEQLEIQEKTLAKEFEKLESELFLIENFIVKKVEMLEEQINSRFKLARFKMFKEQINGGIEECCEVLYGGVPYNSGLNNAARINVGLDIVNTLSEYYGFSAPVFVDNAESVNELIPVNSQVISLIVSKHKKLTVSQTEVQKAS